jgi:GTP-binding protein
LDKVRRWGQKVWDEAVTSFAIQKTANMVDEVTIELKAGKGGDGKVSFRKEKFVPKGGPDGGDGGRGGHIILKGSRQWNTLQHLRNKRTIAADDGEKGGSSRRFGADAKDVIIHVPLGTEAVDVESGKVLAEIMHEGEEILLLRGGKGGWGNERFKTSIRQAPMFARPGDPGEEAWVRLELKLLGDVGLVGLPNAGKSTLLSSISAAKPKIAAYPFTTLSPNLGVVPYKNDQSFTVADIPGIIEGASCGKGLGTQFLKHIERNTMLLFLVAADEEDIAGTYRLLLAEVEAHNPELLNKPRLLVVSKGDLIDDEMEEFLSTEEMPTDCEHLFISSATGKGIEELKDKTFAMLQKAPRPDYVVLTKTKKSDDGVAETLSDEEEAAFPDVEALV